MRRKNHSRDRSKHQHWVPQFYLKYFATPNSLTADLPQVWIFSKEHDGPPEALTSVRNVCGKRYLYSPVQANGERSWDLDEQLDDLESVLGRIWPAVATDFVDLSDITLRKAMALFVSTLHLRHPDMRKQVEKIHGELCTLYDAAPKRDDGRPAVEVININGRTHSLDVSDWHSYQNWTKDDHDRAFAKTLRSEATYLSKILLAKRWSVLLAAKEVFITSDKPVSMHHEQRATYGFGTQGTVVAFPLSPTRVLIFDDLNDEPGNQYYPLAENNLANMNMMIWRGASKFLITGRPVTEVLEEFNALLEPSNDA